MVLVWVCVCVVLNGVVRLGLGGNMVLLIVSMMLLGWILVVVVGLLGMMMIILGL